MDDREKRRGGAEMLQIRQHSVKISFAIATKKQTPVLG